MNDIAYEKRVKRTENDCRVISSAVQSVRILREAFAQLDSEHRAFGDAIDTEKLAWNSTKRSIDRLSLKAVEVVQALDVLFSDYERYLTVVNCIASSHRIMQSLIDFYSSLASPTGA